MSYTNEEDLLELEMQKSNVLIVNDQTIKASEQATQGSDKRETETEAETFAGSVSAYGRRFCVRNRRPFMMLSFLTWAGLLLVFVPRQSYSSLKRIVKVLRGFDG